MEKLLFSFKTKGFQRPFIFLKNWIVSIALHNPDFNQIVPLWKNVVYLNKKVINDPYATVVIQEEVVCTFIYKDFRFIIKKLDFNRRVEPKKKISPHFFTFPEHRVTKA